MPNPDDFNTMAWCYDWVPVPTHARRLRKRLGKVEGTVVDLGGGTARFTSRIFDAKRTRIVVVDVAEKMLQRAVTKRRPVHPVLASAGAIPLPDRSVSAVLCTEAFHHFGAFQDQALREAARVLKPDGVLVIEEPDPTRSWGRFMRWGEHRRHMSSHFLGPADLAARVARHFHDVRDERGSLLTYIVEARRPRSG